MQTQTQETTFAEATRALLDGNAPDLGDLGDLGDYTQTYTALAEAHGVGGVDAVRRAIVGIVKANPGMQALLSGNGNGGAVRTSWTAAELLAAEFPEPRWVIPGFIPEGLTFLAARPKIGKSWLALSICCAVGTGGRVLGENVPRGRALYLATEDNARRLQSRARLQRWPQGAQVDFETDWPQFVTGNGVELLLNRIAAGGYTFVAIDTISRLTRCETRLEHLVSETIDTLQRAALDGGLSIMLVDHHRKPNANIRDVIDDVMGGTFKTGSADAILGMYRKRGERDARLLVTGRDVEEREVGVHFDGLTYAWQVVESAEAAGARVGDLGNAILAALRGDPMGTGDLASLLGKDDGQVSRKLTELSGMGMVYQSTDENDGRKKPWAILPSIEI